MCGIAGVYEQGPAASPESLLLAMAGELKHRGPDGVGLYLDDGFGMVNTRLSIVDLLGGNQPLSDETGRYWVMQNGEIYNHPELRHTLESLGHSFASYSDTEVIAHAYEQWGPACLHELNGDFAFAVWDRAKRELFLARDRFGVRPLFIAHFGGTFAFASEVKALLRHPAATRALDPAGIVALLTLWSELPDRSVFEGVGQLAPGHYLRYGPHGLIEERRWWDVNFVPEAEQFDTPQAELAERLEHLLIDATRIRLRADVPVGTYLSGGLDSSAITALTAGLAPRQHPAFGIGFEDPRFDETEAQIALAEQVGTPLHRLRVSDATIGELFPRVIELAERPMFRTAPAPLLALSKLVADEGIKVVLTGEGADELFGGYDIFKESQVRRFWARDPRSELRPKLLQRLYPYLNLGGGRQWAFQRKFFGRGLTEVDDPLYSHRLRFATGTRNLRFMTAGFMELASRDGAPEDELLGHLPAGFTAMTGLGKAQQLEITTFLSGYLLQSQGDRMLMGNSVEGRFPFLDYRLAEFAARLPDRLRLNGLQEKYLLRKSLTGVLQRTARRRAKQPYRAPIAKAFVSAQAPDYVGELTSEDSIARVGIFDPVSVGKLVAKCRAADPGRLSESDEMALVGVVSTMLLHEQLVAAPRLAPVAVAGRVVRGGNVEPLHADAALAHAVAGS